MNQNQPEVPPQYTWPRYLLAAVVVFVALAVLWMSREVTRIKRIQKDTEDQKRSLVTPGIRSQ